MFITRQDSSSDIVFDNAAAAQVFRGPVDISGHGVGQVVAADAR